MASYVLAGIIYCICDVYIDDIIVNAKTAKELLSNARRVFNRIRKHKLLYILQTTQISLGMKPMSLHWTKTAYQSLSFSTEKIREVLEFPKPTT